MPSYYQLPSDNIAPLGTWTTSIAAQSGYEVAKVADGDIESPSLFWASTAGSVRLVCDHGSAVPLAIAILANHNFPADLDVRLQRHGTNVWTLPDVNEEFTIEPPRPDGYRKKPFAFLPPGNYQFTSIYIPAFASPAALGEAWLGSVLRSFDEDFGNGIAKGPRLRSRRIQNRIPSETQQSGVVYDRGITVKDLVNVGLDIGSEDSTDLESQLDAWRYFYESTLYGALSTIVIRDDAENDAAWIRFPGEVNETYTDPNLITVESMTLEGISTGIPPE